MAADCSALLAAGILAYVAWAWPVHGQAQLLYWQLWPLLGLFPFAYARQGLYPGFGLGGVEIVRRCTLGTTFVFLSVAALSFVIKLPPTYSRMTFVIALALACLLVPLHRYFLLSLARKWRWWGEPALVVGTGTQAARTIASLHSALTLGYRPVGVLHPPGEAHSRVDDETQVEGLPILGSFERAADLAGKGVRAVLIVDEDGRLDPGTCLDDLQGLFRHVIWIRGGAELPVEGVEIKNLGGVIGVEFVNALLIPHNRLLKRSLDLALGVPLALLSTPVILVAAIAIRLLSRGPALWAQEREGLGGRPIRVWKLRTMYVDAEERLDRHLAENPEAHAQWGESFKLRHDPRVLPGIGWFLRRFSLDELPQLWQVARGDLSLVGPRPFPAYHLEHFEPSILTLRRRVRPGVTGLWQIKVRSEGGLEEQQSHDAYYIRNWSLWMDLYVLGSTAAAVLKGHGAY